MASGDAGIAAPRHGAPGGPGPKPDSMPLLPGLVRSCPGLASTHTSLRLLVPQAERLKMNFRRDLDGRVSLRSREGTWYSVRPDMQVSGVGRRVEGVYMGGKTELVDK